SAAEGENEGSTLSNMASSVTSLTGKDSGSSNGGVRSFSGKTSLGNGGCLCIGSFFLIKRLFYLLGVIFFEDVCWDLFSLFFTVIFGFLNSCNVIGRSNKDHLPSIIPASLRGSYTLIVSLSGHPSPINLISLPDTFSKHMA